MRRENDQITNFLEALLLYYIIVFLNHVLISIVKYVFFNIQTQKGLRLETLLAINHFFSNFLSVRYTVSVVTPTSTHS